MSKELTLPESLLLAPRVFGFLDHFLFKNTLLWTTIEADGGSATIIDGHGGIIRLVTDDTTPGADNDQAWIHTPDVFTFGADQPGEAIARLKWEEANDDDANVLFGLLDAPAADDLQDNGAGPPSSYSGAVFFKVDGETQWRFETSIGSTQTTTLLAATTPDGASDWHSLKITWRMRSATVVEIVPWIDENGGQDFKIALDDSRGLPVKHEIDLGSPLDMALAIGVKQGGSVVETVDCDYAGAYALL